MSSDDAARRFFLGTDDDNAAVPALMELAAVQSSTSLVVHLRTAYAQACALERYGAAQLSARDVVHLYHGYIVDGLDAFCARHFGTLSAYISDDPNERLDGTNRMLLAQLVRGTLTSIVADARDAHAARGVPAACRCSRCSIFDTVGRSERRLLVRTGYAMHALRNVDLLRDATQTETHNAVLRLVEAMWTRPFVEAHQQQQQQQLDAEDAGLRAANQEFGLRSALERYVELLRVRVGRLSRELGTAATEAHFDGATTEAAEARREQHRLLVLSGQVSDQTMRAHTIPMVGWVAQQQQQQQQQLLSWAPKRVQPAPSPAARTQQPRIEVPWLVEMFMRLEHTQRLLRIGREFSRCVQSADVRRADALRAWAARRARAFVDQRETGERLRERMLGRSVLAPGDRDRFAREHQGVVPPRSEERGEKRVALWTLPGPLMTTYWTVRAPQRHFAAMIESEAFADAHPLVAGAATMQAFVVHLDNVVDREGDPLFAKGLADDLIHCNWWRDVVFFDADYERRTANLAAWRAPYIAQLGGAYHVVEAEREQQQQQQPAEMQHDDDDDQQQQQQPQRAWILRRYHTTTGEAALCVWMQLIVSERYGGWFRHNGKNFDIGRPIKALLAELSLSSC